MARVLTALAAPACTSFNSLGNSLTGVASSAASTVGATANAVDHLVEVTLTSPATFTGSATTQVNLFVYGSIDGTIWSGMGANTGNIELIDGTDKTITWGGNGNNAKFLGTVQMPVSASAASVVYKSEPLSVAAAFGGTLPAKYVIVAQNQAGAALPAAGHSIAVTEVAYT